MPLKRYKVTFEFFLDIDELTDELATENIRRYSNFTELVRSPEHWEHVERQRHLLQALLEDEEVLREYVQNEVASQLEVRVEEQVKERLGDIDRDEDILIPLIDQLPPEDAVPFEEAIENGVFYENTEEFSRCFNLNLRRVSIGEVIYEED